jgi:hypothetical protein
LINHFSRLASFRLFGVLDKAGLGNGKKVVRLAWGISRLNAQNKNRIFICSQKKNGTSRLF